MSMSESMCINCGHKNPGDAVTCEQCGARLKRMADDDESMREIKAYGDRDPLITCPSCRNRVFASHLTCPRCGANLADGKANNSLRRWFEICNESDEYNPYNKYARAKKMEAAEEQAGIIRSQTSGRSNRAVAGMRRCRSCWHDNPPGAEVCGKCGASLSRSNSAYHGEYGADFCRCNFNNPPLVRVCARCGKIVGPKCPVCNYLNSREALQCAQCGEPLPY